MAVLANQAFTLAELAERFKVEFSGDPNCKITGVGSLANAKVGDISFLQGQRWSKYLDSTQASAIILTQIDLPACKTAALITDNPQLIFAQAASLFTLPTNNAAGIHSSVVIGEHCDIHPSVSIGANTVIESHISIAANSHIGPNCVIGTRSEIGSDSQLSGHVTLYPDTKIGQHVIIHSGAVIGSDGFSYALNKGCWHKVPQLGCVVIEDDVEIGANTTIDRGALEDTCIGKGVKIDNQVHIAHNVKIGDFTAIAGCVGIAGSVIIGKHCRIAGGVGIAGHLELADNITITGMSLVSKSILQPGVYSSGTALDTNTQWRKNAVRFRQLDEMARRIKTLEEKLGKG